MPSHADVEDGALLETREIGALLHLPWEERIARGFGHTLREVAQQPAVWPDVAARVAGRSPDIATSLAGVEAIALTGSGSSQFACECVAPALQRRLGLPATAPAAGTILTHPETCLPPSDACLLVSLARSGNSPESRAAVDWLLETRPGVRHLLITCNRDGALASSYSRAPGVRSVVLPDEVNDQSLVMTSSFTSLVLAGLGLGVLDALEEYQTRVRVLSRMADRILLEQSDALASAARSGFRSAVYLGSGCRHGAARESALKLTEMTGGSVPTIAESFLGLRHGPMSAVDSDTLVVAFLSSDAVPRAYEVDLLHELRRKGIGARRVIVGAGIPTDVEIGPDDAAIDVGRDATIEDEYLSVVDVLAGQLLAFFRSLDSGFRPDSPSEDGIITRVVSDFEIHGRQRGR